MKKVLSVLLTLAMIFSLIPMGTFTLTANALTEGYYTYTVTDGKATITDVDTSISGDVTIPSTLGGYPVIGIDRSAFEGCVSITSIVILDGVTTISEYAFFDCQTMTSITLPDNVTSIGNYAFLDTGYYLNEDNWKDNVLYIGNHLIKANSSINGNYTIKDGTLTIADYAFAFKEELTGIVISNSVKNIGESAFGGCAALESIEVDSGNTVFHSEGNCIIDTENKVLVVGCKNSNIPTDDSVTSIGDYAFYGNYEVTNITIPENITSIGWCSFAECGGLAEIIISDSVKSIGEGAFEECESLIDVWYSGSEEDKENISFADGNDYLLNATWHYDKDDDDESYYTYTVTDSKATITDVSSSISGDVTIPSTLGGYPVTSIGTRAFDWCENITSITIPDGVISIDEGAFDCCTGVQTITIPDSVTSIGERAFAWCENLTSITIPGGVTSIGESMFYYCSKLTSVTLPSSVTNIGRSAFEGCASITSIVIPNGVTSISEYAFFDCQALTSITLPDSITNIGRHTFLDTGYYLNEDNWEKGALYIGKHLVKINTSISDEYTVKEGTLTIAVYAFAGQEELTGITLPDSVKSIGEGAFEECLSLANICFGGSEEDKENINFADGNDCLLNATWYYNVCTDGHTYSYFYDSWCNNCSWSRGDREPTTLHALEMQQNMLGITTLPYGHFDMNFDKKVDSTDLVILQTLILGL